MVAMRMAEKQIVRRFIRRIGPSAVRISDLGATGTAMLLNKGRSSSRAAMGSFYRAMGLMACVFLAAANATAAAANLSSAEAMRIGRKIWQNECNGTVAGLTAWNSGENFASLGIGHF